MHLRGEAGTGRTALPTRDDVNGDGSNRVSIKPQRVFILLWNEVKPVCVEKKTGNICSLCRTFSAVVVFKKSKFNALLEDFFYITTPSLGLMSALKSF